MDRRQNARDLPGMASERLPDRAIGQIAPLTRKSRGQHQALLVQHIDADMDGLARRRDLEAVAQVHRQER